jgi:hypothetical protein
MSLQGLADFEQPIQVAGAQIFYPYEGNGPHLLTPDSLEIAERAAGRPDFQLALVRGRTPMLPPKPYGLLDLRLRAHYPIEESLQIVRASRPQALLAPIAFTAGFLRLRAGTDLGDAPPDLLRPIALTWNGLGMTRTVMKLASDGAALIKRALESQVLLLHALAELEIAGVAPRLPLHVAFDPAELLQAVLGIGNQQREVSLPKLEEFFRQEPAKLPLTVRGELVDSRHEAFVQALVDRVRQHFGSFVPAPEESEEPHIALAAPEQVGHGRFEWDLSEPALVARTLILRLDPLAAARELVAREGLAAVVHETIVPPLSTGALSIAVSANLPPQRDGILALGVNLFAPARPPRRPQAATAAAELHPPDDAATLPLRLAPGEEPQYRYTTFVVLQDAGGIEQLEGIETLHQGEVLSLGPDDFPIDFVAIEAARALLELAEVQVTLSRPDGTATVEQTYALNLDRPATALALPKGTAGVLLEVVARERGGTGVLTLGPLPAESMTLDCYSFRQYGSQQVDITCTFTADAPSFAIELQPEAAADTSVLFFRPDQPQRRWTWFADSPFRPGYRYRRLRNRDQPADEWSAVQSPSEPLVLQVSTDQEGDHAGTT